MTIQAMAPRLQEANPQGPTSAPRGGASAPESLVVLTRDPQFLETLCRIATGRAVHPVSAEADLAAHLVQGHGGVAVIDAAATASPLGPLTGRLKEQFPDLVMVVAGDAADQASIAARVTDGTVYRFLHKPVSEQRVELFVAAAWRRHDEEHAGIVSLARTQPVKTLPAHRSRLMLWGGVIAAAGLGGGVVAWKSGSRTPAPSNTERSVATVAAAPRAPEPSPPPMPLEVASAASEATTTPAASATPASRASITAAPAERFRSARTTAPAAEIIPAASSTTDSGNPLMERIVDEARNALDEGKAEEAERLIELAAQSGASPEMLEPLVRDARDARIAARAATMTRLSQLFNDRLHSGRLLEPANDSAEHYSAELARVDVDHPSTRFAREALSEEFLRMTRTEIEKGQMEAARHWLAEARGGGAGAEQIAALRTRIETAEAKAPTQTQSPIAPPIKIHHENPRYPAEALARNAEGWVDLSYTVEADGSVGEIAITRAEPAGLFDRAAIEAVRRWRYEPAASGEAGGTPTSVRIRFDLQ
jgi:TonB family protein